MDRCRDVDSFAAMVILNPTGIPGECWRLPGPMFAWLELQTISSVYPYTRPCMYILIENRVDPCMISLGELTGLLRQHREIPEDLAQMVWTIMYTQTRSFWSEPRRFYSGKKDWVTPEELARTMKETGYSPLGAMVTLVT